MAMTMKNTAELVKQIAKLEKLLEGVSEQGRREQARATLQILKRQLFVLGGG
jgi:hypothetical protein